MAEIWFFNFSFASIFEMSQDLYEMMLKDIWYEISWKSMDSLEFEYLVSWYNIVQQCTKICLRLVNDFSNRSKDSH